MTTEQLIAKALAAPKTHKCVTLYDDGSAKEHLTASLAQANNFAIGERRKIGRRLIDRVTNNERAVVDVYVTAI